VIMLHNLDSLALSIVYFSIIIAKDEKLSSLVSYNSLEYFQNANKNVKFRI